MTHEPTYLNEPPSNALSYFLATIGALVAVPLQMFYLLTVGLINYVDGVVAGVIIGLCIVGGFKLGGGVAKKSFPVYPIILAVLSTLLGFMLGISAYLYQNGWDIGDAVVFFFDDYLFADFEGTTIYYSLGIINVGIAIGIAVLFIGGKRYIQQSLKEGEALGESWKAKAEESDDSEGNEDVDMNDFNDI